MPWIGGLCCWILLLALEMAAAQGEAQNTSLDVSHGAAQDGGVTLGEYIREKSPTQCLEGFLEHETVFFSGTLKNNYSGPENGSTPWPDQLSISLASPSGENDTTYCTVNCNKLSKVGSCYCQELKGDSFRYVVKLMADLPLSGGIITAERLSPDGSTAVGSGQVNIPHVYGIAMEYLTIAGQALPLKENGCHLKLPINAYTEIKFCVHNLKPPYLMTQTLGKVALPSVTLGACSLCVANISAADDGKVLTLRYKEETGCERDKSYQCRVSVAIPAVESRQDDSSSGHAILPSHWLITYLLYLHTVS